MVPGSLTCHGRKASFTAVRADGSVARVTVKLGEPESWPALSTAARFFVLRWCIIAPDRKRRMIAGGWSRGPTSLGHRHGRKPTCERP